MSDEQQSVFDEFRAVAEELINGPVRPSAQKWVRRGKTRWQPRLGTSGAIWRPDELDGPYKSWGDNIDEPTAVIYQADPSPEPVLYRSARRAMRVAKRRRRAELRYAPWEMSDEL